MNKNQSQNDEMRSKFFIVASAQLAEVSISLEKLALSLASDEAGCTKSFNIKNLISVLNNIKKVKIGSTLCGFEDVTEVTFILEYLLTKMIENKLPRSSTHIDKLRKANDILRMQVKSMSLDIPVDSDELNDLQTLLNNELNQVSP
jgi:two-component system chemotaxis sensor kinase CheA